MAKPGAVSGKKKGGRCGFQIGTQESRVSTPPPPLPGPHPHSLVLHHPPSGAPQHAGLPEGGETLT